MQGFGSTCLTLLLGAWLAMPAGMASAAQPDASGFGDIAIPDPPRPAQAENCVEPVDVMRRQHMVLLDRQRDRTVIDGERNGKYSLVGCMNCHNPVTAGGEAPGYGEADHFCSTCHAYASVEIDCFECHADRGHDMPGDGYSKNAWDADSILTAATARRRLEIDGGD